MESLAANDLSNFIIYDNISSSTDQQHCHGSSETSNISDEICNDKLTPLFLHETLNHTPCVLPQNVAVSEAPNASKKGRKRLRSRRRSRVFKNKEEAETQRMTHIFVERNRRKQMKEHLSILRSLMPESYTQRGDQASIVGGAIEFLKELEQFLQSLEAQKLILQQQQGGCSHDNTISFIPPPFAQFFSYPQYLCNQIPNEYPPEIKPAIADIEVTLVDSHANLRILSKRRPKQLLKMVAGFQALLLTVLHLNVTTLDPLVFYSFNLKVEEGCRLISVDDLAGTVHQMLRIIEDEAALC